MELIPNYSWNSHNIRGFPARHVEQISSYVMYVHDEIPWVVQSRSVTVTRLGMAIKCHFEKLMAYTISL